ncbi:cytochrome P450 [Lindgomyces ingoldianus]|uniref:Cytochrome P450 n=1 Tax=Lindgomyces ingoldianus TaxID=673940 RepID=A0ACB6R6E1_9PLEO|nr:cytochrome P450 [Lindgomyces ingoldianus]KAF2474021.1 cytochrome P450 [Lindgomyces ingoldianus]
MYKNTTTISYHSMIKEMHHMIGVSNDGISKLFTINPSHKHNVGMSVPTVPALMTNEYHRQQLSPGPHLDDLFGKKILPYIWNTLERRPTAIENPQRITMGNGTPVSLMALMVDLFDGGITSAFFGAAIWEVNPVLLRDFMVWEVTNWKWTFSMPRIISGDMVQAKDAIVNTFVKYLQLPVDKRSDSAFFVKSMEKMMRDSDVNVEDMAKTVMLHFWAVLGNTYKVAFWVFAHIIYDHDLLLAIQKEVEGGFKGGKYDEEYIFQKCPHLSSMVNETLRLAVASPLVRDVVAPTPVGGKVLEPGSRVMVPFHQLHRNRDVWGTEPENLHSDRFVATPKLLNSKSYRPFGGGSTLCPGRNMARRAIAFAVAGLINKYDITIDVKETNKRNGNKRELNFPVFPRINHSKPTPGASLPFKSDDVILVLKERCGTSL